MSKMEIEIDNCISEAMIGKKVHVTNTDKSVDGDNDFHCPIKGAWVELKMIDNKFVCQGKAQCGLRIENDLL